MYPRPISYAVITNLKKTQADSAGGLVRNGDFSCPNHDCLYYGSSATNFLVGKNHTDYWWSYPSSGLTLCSERALKLLCLFFGELE